MDLKTNEQKFLNALGKAFKIHRKSAELSQSELARRAGVSRPMVGLIEKGTHNSTLIIYARIANGLDLTLGAILGEVES